MLTVTTSMPWLVAPVSDALTTPALRIDGDGFLLAPSGAKLARVGEGVLLLWDKRLHLEYPLTVSDIMLLIAQTA